MSVEISSRDTLDPIVVEGEFLDVVNSINTAAANGRSLGVFEEEDGTPVAVFIQNVTRLRGRDNAFVG